MWVSPGDVMHKFKKGLDFEIILKKILDNFWTYGRTRENFAFE